ncbi:MAG: hypothetical protein V1792_02170 [Pseudomonadota bacterium]
MMHKTTILTGVFLIAAGFMAASPQAGPPLTPCSVEGPSAQSPPGRTDSQPKCGIELTCTDKPVLLGYSDGVCFRATCPGVWAVLHKRLDQASFRKRIWTYRHYTFKGYWELKDQGAVQSGPVELREMFLVLPDDLIEFRLQDCDKYARIELRNLGYVKRGDLCELKEWLAAQSYQDGPALIRAAKDRTGKEYDRGRGPEPGCYPTLFGAGIFSGLSSACRRIGLPF